MCWTTFLIIPIKEIVPSLLGSIWFRKMPPKAMNIYQTEDYVKEIKQIEQINRKDF